MVIAWKRGYSNKTVTRSGTRTSRSKATPPGAVEVRAIGRAQEVEARQRV